MRLLAAFVVLLVAIAVVGCSPLATKGTMPPPGPNGELDTSLAPDFIAVAGRDGGIAGYVAKAYLFPKPTTMAGGLDEPPWPVYADDLQTLVGHMVAGKGLVALGVNPATVPKIPVQQGPSFAASATRSGALTLYVRNRATGVAWFTVVSPGEALTEAAMGALGFNNGLGVGCLDVAAGSQLVLVDRPPQDIGATILRVIQQGTDTTDQPARWVDIGADGAITQGNSVPPWWSGPPQDC